MKNLPLIHLQQQDAFDPPESMLPSFSSLRQRTLHALYYSADADTTVQIIIKDKSPKGSVDTRIQSLVDCLNAHESFATLSSCSGRIALYDPNHQQQHHHHDRKDDNENDEEEVPRTSGNNTSSGKGGGGNWLFVSHDPVEPDALLSFFSSDEDQQQQQDDCAVTNTDNTDVNDNDDNDTIGADCSFRFEPMLLHVAACNLPRGQQLLQVALQCGFRESGLVVTDQRVTVAIRSTSLSVAVPLSRNSSSPLRPTRAYVRALTVDANRRLQRNLEKLQALHRAIERSLFLSPSSQSLSSSSSMTATHSSLPNLNLHSHASVVLNPSSQSPTSLDAVILVFGGYGTGPRRNKEDGSNNVGCQRNKHVYYLQPQVSENALPVWDNEWGTVNVNSTVLDDNPHSTITELPFSSGHILVEPCDWQGLQGLTAAPVFDYNTKNKDCTFTVLLFGGRQGPAKPSNDLVLFQYNHSLQSGAFYRPVRGNNTNDSPSACWPSPRWGHTLTRFMPEASLSSSLPRFLLIGGRGEQTTCPDSLYLLSLIPVATTTSNNEDSNTRPTYQFLWEPLIDGIESVVADVCTRFHHSTVALDSHHFFVFGGLLDVNDLVQESFAIDDDDDEDATDGFLLTLSHSVADQPSHQGRLTTTVANVKALSLPSDVMPRFGHAACALSTLSHSHSHQQQPKGSVNILLSGGIVQQKRRGCDSDTDVLQCLQFFSTSVSSSPTPTASENKEWIVTRQPIAMKNASSSVATVDLGVLVHHDCLVIPNNNNEIEVAIVGGGVSGFAFQQLFAPTHCLVLELDAVQPRNARREKPPSHRLQAKAESIGSPQADLSSSHRPQNGGASALSTEDDSRPKTCSVLYVYKQNAKTLKTALEESLLLNKAYRMTAADEAAVVQRVASKRTSTDDNDNINNVDLSRLIAVPVLASCTDLVAVSGAREQPQQQPLPPWWLSLVLGHGHQACPPSSGTFAAGRRGNKNNKAKR